MWKQQSFHDWRWKNVTRWRFLDIKIREPLANKTLLDRSRNASVKLHIEVPSLAHPMRLGRLSMLDILNMSYPRSRPLRFHSSTIPTNRPPFQLPKHHSNEQINNQHIVTKAREKSTSPRPRCRKEASRTEGLVNLPNCPHRSVPERRSPRASIFTKKFAMLSEFSEARQDVVKNAKYLPQGRHHRAE